jgi:uncharacterized protein (DUF1800 family)
MADLEDPRAIAHLLRRAGFGLDAAGLDAYKGLTYEQVVDRLLAGLDEPPLPDPAGFDPYVPGACQQLWLERMVAGHSPLAEKLAFFWHGHFATSNAKVKDAQLMWNQIQLFRTHGAGSLRTLVLEVSRDVAMIRWLDGNSNRKGHPNENYGREVMELFTLGIGHYTEDDVREVARAFTGWGSRRHTFIYTDAFHDNGEKTILGQTGNLGGEEVVELLTGSEPGRRFIATKLIRFFSHPNPTPNEVDAIATVLGRDENGDVRDALRTLFLDPAFRSQARYRALVRSPIEFVVGALRVCGYRTVPSWIHGAVDRMGQILLRPPSVKGWTSGTGWLSSAGLLERLRVAKRLAEGAPLDAVGRVIEVALEGQLSEPLAALTAKTEGRERVALVLGSPEFQLA